MSFSRQLALSLAQYLIKNKLQGRQRYPLVLMLEPTLRCNLACAGCGRIREYRDVLDVELSLDECLQAVKESGAKVVGLSGFLTLAFQSMKDTIDAVKEAGFNDVKFMIGGGQIDDQVKKFTGADAYGKDAMAAVTLAKEWIG